MGVLRLCRSALRGVRRGALGSRHLGPSVVTVAVLFARADSHYREFTQADVYDEARDARTWQGGAPVVAHPPCRGWGRLRKFAKVRPHELDLARFAVAQVRKFGGVLEHPEASTLWAEQRLPAPGEGFDAFGGWTLPIVQQWWGHRARKATWLYIVGCAPRDCPTMPFTLGEASHVVASSRRITSTDRRRPELSKAEREHTPPQLAAWLLDLAARCAR